MTQPNLTNVFDYYVKPIPSVIIVFHKNVRDSDKMSIVKELLHFWKFWRCPSGICELKAIRWLTFRHKNETGKHLTCNQKILTPDENLYLHHSSTITVLIGSNTMSDFLSIIRFPFVTPRFASRLKELNSGKTSLSGCVPFNFNNRGLERFLCPDEWVC